MKLRIFWSIFLLTFCSGNALCENFTWISQNERYAIIFPGEPEKRNAFSINSTTENYMYTNQESQGACFYSLSIAYADIVRDIFLDRDKKSILKQSILEFAKNMGAEERNVTTEFGILSGVGSTVNYNFSYKKDNIDIYAKGIKFYDYNKLIDICASCTFNTTKVKNSNVNLFLSSLSIIQNDNDPTIQYMQKALTGLIYNEIEPEKLLLQDLTNSIKKSGGLHIDLHQFVTKEDYDNVVKLIDKNLRNNHQLKNKKWKQLGVGGYGISDRIDGMGFIWYVIPKYTYTKNVLDNGTSILVHSVN